ncbi:MAG: hypothetical protein AAB487_02085 [Patescibacteria group bacterium]
MPKSKMKKWPERGTVSYPKLIDPILNVLKQAYRFRRKNLGKDIIYRGYDIGEAEQVTCFSPDERLTAKNLKWAQEQGRPALTEIIGIAFHLGMEQGRRLEKKKTEERERRRIL